MPIRTSKLLNFSYYHVYDKSIDNRKVFIKPKIAREFIRAFLYYRSQKSNLRYSKYKVLEQQEKIDKWKEVCVKKYFKVDILAYCIMPNHYHFLLKQLSDNGISSFMANSINSITRFYNVLYNRKGPLFLTQFRSKRIPTLEQLINVSRYIHTNPYAGLHTYFVDSIFTYPFSSIHSYFETPSFKEQLSLQPVLDYFRNDKQKYREYILKNADKQKQTENGKYSESEK